MTVVDLVCAGLCIVAGTVLAHRERRFWPGVLKCAVAGIAIGLASALVETILGL